ncbi:MAG: acyltransferase [Anaerolineae bacterium]|nr:acyltransferase [Anaerolineae bacterium]
MPLLRGLAILAVVLNHAAGHGYTAMFWWAHRYRDVVSPNFDQMGSWPYYGLVAVQQLTLFSVPAFLFISGFFVAYAARGDRATLSWKIVRTRVLGLLWPYLIWSLLIFLVEAAEGETRSALDYAISLLLGHAVGAYFFIPLLVQLYLLAPFLVPLARERGRALIVGAGVVQVVFVGLLYQRYFGGSLPALPDDTPWALVWWAVYFPMGIVCGLHIKAWKAWLQRARYALLVATIVLGIGSIFEAEWLTAVTGAFDWPHATFKLSSMLYAVAFILCFLAFEPHAMPCSRQVEQIGAMSFGIYLLHPKVMELSARAIYHLAPGLLGYQAVFQAIIVLLSIGLPILAMKWAARTPLRKVYRYFFG